ncbi:MAG TPA: histidine phosphatase family protein [Candidatus Saccharimonadales bacterium]|nr:histidine phosphatase family protein [Candidatus Saccharimonadales bacterium]
MKQLYFCRHGLSEFGVEGRWAGSSDSPLAPEGRTQAKKAARQAQVLHIDHIVSSPLSRALDTARIIAEEIGYPAEKIEVNDLTVERDFGELEGGPFNPHANVSKAAGVEPLDVLLRRARVTLKHLNSLDADVVLVVSHGSFGRALRHAINPKIPFSKVKRFENAEIVRLI